MRVLVRCVLLALAAALLTSVPGVPARADVPAESLAVSGTGVSLWPAFDPAITRYAVATTAETAGQLTVDAATADPAGSVLVDGAPAGGPVTVSGLVPGAEVSVIVQDTSGTHAYALVYLPVGFPQITTAVDTGAAEPGLVLLTLGTVAVAVDRNGVPAVLRDFGSPVADLKPAPHGHYTVMVRRPGSASDWELDELDTTFATLPPSPYRTVGLTNTDSHDSVLEPDGTRYLVAYEPDAVTGLTDPVIQEVAPDGQVVSTWDGGDHLDAATETTTDTGSGPMADWAHINAIQVLPDGDVLASFRHLSAVLRIAWTAHDGYQAGDVEWRFGGRLSDFTFPNDPDGGPCAQHAARILANGDLMVYDNGSGALGANPSYCVDPADRTGPTIERISTRVTEYALDTTTMTATLVSSWSYPGRFSYFAGSAWPLPGGDMLVDWAADHSALVSEVDAAGDVVWELSAPTTLSYRAFKADVPDTTKPQVHLALPGAGRYDLGDLGDAAAPSFGCTDTGGSTLQSCVVSPTALDTSVAGTHAVSVTAVDGQGNTTVVRRSYTVGTLRPGALVRGADGWVRRTGLRLPQPGATRHTRFRVTNTSLHPRRVTVAVDAMPRGYGVTLSSAGGRVATDGSWRSPMLAPGASTDVDVVVVRRTRASALRVLDLAAWVPDVPGAAVATAELVLRPS